MSLYCPNCKTTYGNGSGLTECKVCNNKLIQINERKMESNTIECPVCGCGIEITNHIEGSPDQYECTTCGHIGQFHPKYVRQIQYRDVPKCPTCHSENIIAISQIKREFSAFLFGIANPTARAQFECKNCGYKW